MKRNWLIRWLLIVIVGVSFWWLLIDADDGAAPPKPVHIDELRALAAILPGRRPTAVTYTVLAVRNVIGDFYAAGCGLKRRQLAAIVWTLPVPGKGPIMINPGAPPPEAGVGQFSDFNDTAQAGVDRQAGTARLVLTTQGRQPEPRRAAGQPGKAGTGRTRTASGVPAQPLSYTTAQAVAPGVVVIPASSHAPGARLIFVQLADGRELLFVGDLAILRENWVALRARSHLAALWGPAQNRAETYAWLRTIRQLKIEAPQMNIVPGNDYGWLVKQQIEGSIAKFQPPAASGTGVSGRSAEQPRQVAR